MNATTSASVLERFAAAMDARDWTAVAETLTPGFTARFLHTGETFEAGGYVAFQRDYPGAWRFRLDDVVADGDRVVGRAVVHDDTETFHVALFGRVEGERVADLVEMWADDGQSAPERRPPTGPAAPVHVHHAIDYVEISVTDLARAQAFYAAAFGWEFTAYGPEHAGIKAPGGVGELGGLGVGRPSGADEPGVLVLLCSDDLDATLAAVETAGGTIAEAPYDFPGGRRFFFLDPDGNRLGVWQSS